MKLLIDANLSWRLVKRISRTFPGSVHVSKTGLKIPAKDKEIWDWAKKNKYTIVTNDEDFYFLLSVHGFPPKVVLIRMGNQSTDYVADILVQIRIILKRWLSQKSKAFWRFIETATYSTTNGANLSDGVAG